MMSKNKLKNIIEASILNNITEPDQSTPYSRLFNLINQHFLDNNRILTYPDFISYVFSAMSGKVKLEFNTQSRSKED